MSLESLLDVITYVQEKDDLTGNEVLVLIALANYTDKAGKALRFAYYSQSHCEAQRQSVEIYRG